MAISGTFESPGENNMHYKIRYHNKPHFLRLSGIRMIPLGKGILLVACELNYRGYKIDYHGGSSCGDKWKKTSFSVYFGDDESMPPSNQKMRAELTLYPDTPEEASMALQIDSISKTTYRCILVTRKCLDKKWEEYTKNRRWAKALKAGK